MKAIIEKHKNYMIFEPMSFGRQIINLFNPLSRIVVSIELYKKILTNK